KARPVAGRLPVHVLPALEGGAPLLAVTDGCATADRGVEVGQEGGRLLRAAGAVVERHQADPADGSDEARHARGRPLAAVGGRGVEVKLVGTGSTWEAEHGQAGLPHELLRGGGGQLRVPPIHVHAQDLGVDGAQHLPDVHRDRRGQGPGLERLDVQGRVRGFSHWGTSSRQVELDVAVYLDRGTEARVARRPATHRKEGQAHFPFFFWTA